MLAAILNYFLQDAEVQNVVVGCVIILQIASFIATQVYLKAHLSIYIISFALR